MSNVCGQTLLQTRLSEARERLTQDTRDVITSTSTSCEAVHIASMKQNAVPGYLFSKALGIFHFLAHTMQLVLQLQVRGV